MFFYIMLVSKENADMSMITRISVCINFINKYINNIININNYGYQLLYYLILYIQLSCINLYLYFYYSDYLFFDGNGLISDKLHELQKDDLIDKYDITKITDIIFEKIDIMVNIMKPKKFVGIFIDSVSPKAKWNLQRHRRIREYSKYSNECSFNFNNISNGTEFMTKFSEFFENKIKIKKNSDSIWKKIEVVFSGPDVAGEGDYKMFDYIKENNVINSNSKNYEKGCIYSTDSDFYLLLLANHFNSFLVYNEFDNRNNKLKKKVFFSIRKFRQTILDLFPSRSENEHDKLINDFVCLCFLTRNNYLPGIHDVLFDDIVEVYQENYKTIRLTNDNGKLNEKGLKIFFHLLKKKIVPINKMVYFLDNKMKSDFSEKVNSTMSNNDDNNLTVKCGK